MATNNCPFCAIAAFDPKGRILEDNEHAYLIRDGYPVSLGHSLVIPKRHIASFFDVTPAEQVSLLELVRTAQIGLEATYKPDSYNIGINDGPAAGQTVPHLHLHIIPRYTGDQDDPRGGVRWVLPAKANYWDCP